MIVPGRVGVSMTSSRPRSDTLLRTLEEEGEKEEDDRREGEKERDTE